MRRNRGKKLGSLVDRVCMQAADPESAAIFHIVKNWVNIVGKELAQLSAPIKISKVGKSSILIIGVYHPSLSIKLQSEENHILENIAKLVGYRMVKKIRLKHLVNMQKLADKPAHQMPKHKLSVSTESALTDQINQTNDPEMAEILQKLRNGFFI